MDASPEVEFGRRSALMIAITILLNIIWWTVMIAAIVLGAIHLNHCTVQPYIPIYLIVVGASSILSLSLTYAKSTWDDGCVHILSSACAAVLHLFNFCWLIAGSTWVYAVYPPKYTPGFALTIPYCHKTTYLLAFGVTTLVWVTMALMFIGGCCFALLTCCGTVAAGHRLIPSRNSFYGATANVEEPPVGDV